MRYLVSSLICTGMVFQTPLNFQQNSNSVLWLVIIGAGFTISVMLWQYLRKVHRLNRELRESNRVKDMLFSIIGHDLKGPASSASQMFRIMETEDFPPSELKVMISELRKQTEASFEVLNTLFEWGKAQLKGVKIQAERVELKNVVEQNLTLLAPQSVLKDILITCKVKEADAVFADPHHVNFIIRNLLSNAIKFTADGGSVMVDAHTDGHMLTVSVKDTGIGMTHEQLYEFETGSLKVVSGTRGEKGSGLGLMLSKEFITVNNGKFWLKSNVGHGTTFFFSLPCHQ